MEKIKIYSPFDCLIYGREGGTFLSANEHLILDREESLFVYPTNRGEGYSFVLDSAKDSPFYKSITYKEERLIFLLGGLLSNAYLITPLSFKGKTCHIKRGRERIVVEYDGWEREFILPHEYANISHKMKGDILQVLCEGSPSILIALNLKSKKVKYFEGDITLNENGFTLNTPSSQSEYLIDGDGLSRTKVKLAPATTISVHFFSCLKEGDYSLAYSLLSSNLQEGLSQKSFKEFFGRITYFYPLSENEVFALSDGSCRVYCLTIEGEKISEIND